MRAYTSAPPTYRGRFSAGKSPTTWRGITSSRFVQAAPDPGNCPQRLRSDSSCKSSQWTFFVKPLGRAVAKFATNRVNDGMIATAVNAQDRAAEPMLDL